MKRWFSALIMFVMLFSFCNMEALADTLKLPSQTKTISTQAFYGDTALDVVELPYGTETIKSKAFAYSSIKEIYIPSTVTYIADNAFAGAEDVFIYAPDGSYAQEYAENNDFICFNYKDRSGATALQEVLDDLESFDDDQTITLDFEYSLLSEEGIDDEELLEHVNKYNQYTLALQETDNETKEYINGLMDCFNSIGELAESTYLSDDGDTFTMGCDLFSYTISGDDLSGLNGPVKVISSSVNEDEALYEVECNKAVYYISIDQNGFSISRGAKENIAVLNTNGDEDKSLLEKIKDKITKNVVFDTIRSQITEGEKFCKKAVEDAELARREAETLEKSCRTAALDAEFEYYKRFIEDPQNAAEYERKWRAAQNKWEEANRAFKKAENQCMIRATNLKLIKGACEGFEKINIFMISATIASDIAMLTKLGIIKSHNHPNTADGNDAEKLEKIREMNENLIKAATCLTCEGLLNALDLVAAINAISCICEKVLVPGGFITSWVQELGFKMAEKQLKKSLKRLALPKGIAEAVIGAYGQNKAEEVFETDKTLHAKVRGTVKDKETEEPIKGVKITCNGETAYTNSNGEYEISASTGEQVFVFTKQGYNMREYKTNVTQNTPPLNITMESRGTVAGHVYDAVTGRPIGGVRVTYGNYATTTDSDGFYKFIVRLGTEKMVFSMTGYIDVEYENVESKLNTTTKRDAVMTKKLNRNQYRAVLTWGATPADLDAHLTGPDYHVYYASKTGTNATLDLDDTTSYGPETITFTVNQTGTYTYYVHDYTNRGKSGSRALAGSNAIVRVYCGSEQLAEVHVPSGTGLNWYVFTVTNGQFKLTNKIQ